MVGEYKVLEDLGDLAPYCGSSSCTFGSKKDKRGQHTNGRCNCLSHESTAGKMYFRRMPWLISELTKAWKLNKAYKEQITLMSTGSLRVNND